MSQFLITIENSPQLTSFLLAYSSQSPISISNSISRKYSIDNNKRINHHLTVQFFNPLPLIINRNYSCQFFNHEILPKYKYKNGILNDSSYSFYTSYTSNSFNSSNTFNTSSKFFSSLNSSFFSNGSSNKLYSPYNQFSQPLKRYFHANFPSRPSSSVVLYNAEHAMSKEDAQYLEAIIAFHPIQIFVTQFRLSEGSPRHVATHLFNHWRLPRDGILFYLSLDERRLEIITGHDAQYAIDSQFLVDLQKNDIFPEFKNQNFFEGIKVGVEKIIMRKEWYEQLTPQMKDKLKNDIVYISFNEGVDENNNLKNTEGKTNKSNKNSLNNNDNNNDNNSDNNERNKTNNNINNKNSMNNKKNQLVLKLDNQRFFDLNIVNSNSNEIVDDSGFMHYAIIFFLFISMLFILFLLLKSMTKKCKKCGSHNTTQIVDCNSLYELYATSFQNTLKNKKIQNNDRDELIDMFYNSQDKQDEIENKKLTQNDYHILETVKPKEDIHGSSTVDFTTQLQLQSIQKCLDKLQEGNWGEIKIGAVNHLIYKCYDCGNEFLHQYYHHKYSKCNSCQFHGRVKLQEKVTEYPTITYPGKMEVIYNCELCDHKEIVNELIPIIRRSNVSNSSYSNHSSHSGSSSSGSGSGGSY